MRKIDPSKAHQFNVNESFWSFHTKHQIMEGTRIAIGKFTAIVKKIVRDRPSIYHKNHYYYEIEIS